MKYNVVTYNPMVQTRDIPWQVRTDLTASELDDFLTIHADYTPSQIRKIIEVLDFTEFLEIKPKGYMQRVQNHMTFALHTAS